MGENEGSGPRRDASGPEDGTRDDGLGRTFEAIPVVGQVVQKTSRFSREFVATMIALASSAFGVVAALAWNTAITTWFTSAFGTEASAPKVRSLFLYAVIATLVGVVVIVILGRLATRINAQPVEFKYPASPKPQG